MWISSNPYLLIRIVEVSESVHWAQCLSVLHLLPCLFVVGLCLWLSPLHSVLRSHFVMDVMAAGQNMRQTVWAKQQEISALLCLLLSCLTLFCPISSPDDLSLPMQGWSEPRAGILQWSYVFATITSPTPLSPLQPFFFIYPHISAMQGIQPGPTLFTISTERTGVNGAKAGLWHSTPPSL